VSPRNQRRHSLTSLFHILTVNSLLDVLERKPVICGMLCFMFFVDSLFDGIGDLHNFCSVNFNTMGLATESTFLSTDFSSNNR
jgi:hypothetical protein